MDRRTAITTAVAITVTTLAGGSAIAANVGILGADETGNVGELSPVAVRSEDTTPTTDAGVTVETVYVDETVPGPVGATPAPTAPAPAPTAAPPPATHDGEPGHVFDDLDDLDDLDDHHDDDHDDDHDDEHDGDEDEHEHEDEHEDEHDDDD
ncbi:MAG: hypothetical protein KatS3mg009_3219 [Acidimicrobiia bacterium]|nr:MAG: hypothetical protein KatS3mg009_3219 [Acidimicrobiia bacterium]